MAAKQKIDLSAKAQELVTMAQNSGLEQDFFFTTTFARYQVQLKILSDLQVQIANSETLVSKEYVKGRKNLYTNPAINEYNKTAQAANHTVQTLLKIITTLSDNGLKGKAAGDEFLDFISKSKAAKQ